MRILEKVGLAFGNGSSVGYLQRRSSQTPVPGEPAEVVVLVHGLIRSSLSMRPLQNSLEAAGYRVLNWSYSSYRCSIDELSHHLQADLQAEVPAGARVHFVGHSLGAIIIRRLLSRNGWPDPGRVVMLAPPNQGSYTADRWTPYLGWLLKPLEELRTTPSSTVRSLPPLERVTIGIIAAEHDGKVMPNQTRLVEQADHVLVPAMHTFMMSRGDVQQLTLTFLRHGRFTLDAGGAPTALGADPLDGPYS